MSEWQPVNEWRNIYVFIETLIMARQLRNWSDVKLYREQNIILDFLNHILAYQDNYAK